jgi:hypothetical protein
VSASDYIPKILDSFSQLLKQRYTPQALQSQLGVGMLAGILKK